MYYNTVTDPSYNSMSGTSGVLDLQVTIGLSAGLSVREVCEYSHHNALEKRFQGDY